jgi:hypothetical protein
LTPFANTTKRSHARLFLKTIIRHKQAERRKTVPYNNHPPRHGGLAQKNPLSLRTLISTKCDVKFKSIRFALGQAEEPDLRID